MSQALAFESSALDPDRGFLPARDPLPCLPAAFAVWEDAARALPKWLAAGTARAELAALPAHDPSDLAGEDQLERAMLLLSYFGHAYVWGAEPPARRLPAALAVPWQAVARRVGRPPVLSYASYALYNWRRLDPDGPVALGNIALLQNFLGGLDEEWFILVHVEIEARAGTALAAIEAAQAAAGSGDDEALREALESLAAALEGMHASLARMPEGCDPYVYYRRVRPYIHGWKDNPALPEGLVYEGVGGGAGVAQRWRGETGAQSSIMPSLDAGLGIRHADDPLRPYLLEMRDYMPPAHRAWLEAVEAGPPVRERVLASRAGTPLVAAYNACIDWVQRFRALHLDYAANYINRQAQIGPANPVELGTGGTPFMDYLRKHRDETAGHLIG